VVRLENCYNPWELELPIVRFVGYYNQERTHSRRDGSKCLRSSDDEKKEVFKLKHSPIFLVFCTLTLAFSAFWMEGCSEDEMGETSEAAKPREAGDQSTADSQAGTPRGSAVTGAALATWPYFEAEEATEIHPPMVVEQNADASGGKYIVSPREVEGWIRFDINIPDDGVYILWGSTFAKDGGSNSFLVGANTDVQPGTVWDVPLGGWQWSKVTSRTGALTFELSKGKNSFIFWNREADTQLDQIFITTDPNASP